MIIDAHAHFINKSILRAKTTDETILNSIQDLTPQQGRDIWLGFMDAHNIQQTVFMALGTGNRDFTQFINSSDRFIGLATVDPTQENAVGKLDADIKAGYSGLKLYASEGNFDVADRRAYKVYEYCAQNNLPIVIHFGVSIGNADLRFGNPLSLSPVVRYFPTVKFVIAHFGAGFFKEALMIMYGNKNVYFDTSGTNNWLDYSPFGWTLKDIFKHALKAIGSERILFGSDTHRLGDGYRTKILEEQKAIVNELAHDAGVQNIFYDNAKRVFKLK